MRARFEYVGKRYIVDVAHNPHGFESLVDALRHHRVARPVVVFGIMADKDVGGIIELLQPICGAVVTVQPQTPRAMRSSALARLFRQAGVKAINGGSVPRGITIARKLASPNQRILITGSHYLVGEALRFIA